MNEFSELTGRCALVTGASRGIGRAIARRLAAHGVRVAVTATEKSRAGLEETCGFIAAAGGTAVPYCADLSSATARQLLVQEVLRPWGAIHILVNNAAAITAYAPPSRMDAVARHGMFEVNFHAPVDLTQLALPGMRDAGWGRILNISSETARQPPVPYPGPAKLVHALAVYGASKAALDRYTLGIAAELHGTGIHANALSPYKIARTESAELVARQMVASHPDWVEPVEMMAEAALGLIAGKATGVVTNSRDWLHRSQTPVRALDGKTVMGDALTLVNWTA